MHQGRGCSVFRTGSRLACDSSSASAPDEITLNAHKECAVVFLNFILHDRSASPPVQDDSVTPAVPHFISDGELEALAIIGLAEDLLPAQKCLFERSHAKNLQDGAIFRIGEVRHLPWA